MAQMEGPDEITTIDFGTCERRQHPSTNPEKPKPDAPRWRRTIIDDRGADVMRGRARSGLSAMRCGSVGALRRNAIRKTASLDPLVGIAGRRPDDRRDDEDQFQHHDDQVYFRSFSPGGVAT
jgi:hypothetical protein